MQSLCCYFFSCHSNSQANQRTSLLYSSGGIMQKANAELDHYSLSVITLGQMCRSQRKKTVIYPHSAKYADTWYRVDQIISGLHGCH